MAYVAESGCPKCGKRKRFGWGRTQEEATVMMNKRYCTACEVKWGLMVALLIGVASWAVIQLALKIWH